MDTEIRQILAENVKRLRELRGLSIADLVTRTGLSQRQLNGLERAEKHARLDTLDKLAHGLRVPEWVLLFPPAQHELLNGSAFLKLAELYAQLPDAARDQLHRVAEAEARYHSRAA